MAFKSFFDNYFYGKSGKADFTEKNLPGNRLQLFRDVFMVRKGSMVGLNLLYLLIWLPAAIWTFINVVQLASIDAQMLDSLVFTYLLILFPLIAITGPFTAGISFVMRNWARDEHAFAFLDFKKGMKDNWKQALLMSAINGALPLLLYICIYFYSGMAQGNAFFYLPVALVLIAAVIWNLGMLVLPTLMVGYRLNFAQLVKNSAILTLAALPRAIAIRLATLALPLLFLLLSIFVPSAASWLGAIVLAAYLIIVPSFNKLITASYANALCEKYLNPKIEGAQVNIGLRPKGE